MGPLTRMYFSYGLYSSRMCHCVIVIILVIKCINADWLAGCSLNCDALGRNENGKGRFMVDAIAVGTNEEGGASINLTGGW